MAELPILPLHTDALLADTSHMSAEQFGAYVRLLLVAWRHGAKLTNDADELARIAGVSRRRWDEIAPVVMRPMTIVGAQISQKRLTDTWMRVLEIRRHRSQNGRKAWSKRRHKQGDTQ